MAKKAIITHPLLKEPYTWEFDDEHAKLLTGLEMAQEAHEVFMEDMSKCGITVEGKEA